jgi:hypothetical protein
MEQPNPISRVRENPMSTTPILGAQPTVYLTRLRGRVGDSTPDP